MDMITTRFEQAIKAFNHNDTLCDTSCSDNKKHYTPKDINIMKWERAKPLPTQPFSCKRKRRYHPNGKYDNKGYYGFNTPKFLDNEISPLVTCKGEWIFKSIKEEHNHIYPNTVINMIPIIMTPDGMQIFIDKINNKANMIACDDITCCNNGQRNHVDPHYCSKDNPCNMELKRTHHNKPDFRWGLHVLAIDYEKISDIDYVPKQDDSAIIIPEHHNTVSTKWYTEWNVNKYTNIAYPLCSYDVEILREPTIKKYFDELKKQYEYELAIGKKIYILSNLFGKDQLIPGMKKSEFHKESIQIHRGKVDNSDLRDAGITLGNRHIDYDTIVKCGKICACRETYEESDKSLNIDIDDPNLKLIGDYQQNSNKMTRVMVFCYDDPLNIENILVDR